VKTLVQKIIIEEQHSFACKTYRTPHFETNWHLHEEAELIIITEGAGTVMIGDYVGEYKQGDVFFIAGLLPHWFRKQHSRQIGAAKVAQFNTHIFGNGFLENPELSNIQMLLNKKDGISLPPKQAAEIHLLLSQMEKAKGFNRMQLLLDALHLISNAKQKKILTQNFTDTGKTDPAIERIIDYSFKNYLSPITLQEVASIAEMSIPTFCRFFKKNIKKTYFEFLQELRINHACNLLKTTNKQILTICYESGYNSWAHFSQKFKQIKKLAPNAYRKEFKAEMT
jgi:AraC-like DNA-binding protein/mannose-6-phosphate isomerase-like protein (cupin superfamily)